MDMQVAHEMPVASQRKKSRKARNALMLSAGIVLIVGIGALGCFVRAQVHPAPDTGAFLIPQGDMTDEEAQAMLDDQAERSRITVSIRPVQELAQDGKLHVNFVVVPDNNGFSERLEIEQDGVVVYRSGTVQPEHVIRWGNAPAAHAGAATATVYAVDGEGRDAGNPVSVEVEIIESQQAESD